MSANVRAYTRERECEKTIKTFTAVGSGSHNTHAYNAQARTRAAIDKKFCARSRLDGALACA